VTEFPHGLMIGKFYPPHRGHHAAIRAAAARCGRFTVLVMASAVETIPLDDRVQWLRDEHAGEPGIEVRGIRCDAPLDLHDQQVWAAQVALMRAALRHGGGSDAVDAVFGGESYVTGLAHWLGAKAVRIARSALSASAVRDDLAGRWADLAPATRAGLATRVVVVGAESTGTTTVARALADHYASRGGSWTTTQCVAEFGRDYTSIKMDRCPGVGVNDLIWTADDFDIIGPQQTRQENCAAREGSPLLVCDTDALATTVWERRYLGEASRSCQPWADVPPRAVYLVTDHRGVPWHDDGLREGDLDIRGAMTDWFIDTLTAAAQSWVLLTGSLEQRIGLAIRTVDPLLQHRNRFGAPLTGPGFQKTVGGPI
jgi:NadR type nicotinamide-nucleotide adenylyltransferase